MRGWKKTIWCFAAGNLLIGGFLFFSSPERVEAGHDNKKNPSTQERGTPPAAKEPAKEVTLDQVVAHLSKSPHFQELYTLMEEKYPSDEEAFTFALELGIRGRARLNDEMLAKWAGVKAKMLDQFKKEEEATCAAVARENPDSSQLLKSVTHMAQKHMDVYWAIYLKAAEAELDGDKIILLDHKEMGNAWRGFLSPLPEETSSRVQSFLQKKEKSDEDACWVGKTLFAILTTMNVPQKEILIRTLAVAPVGQVLPHGLNNDISRR